MQSHRIMYLRTSYAKQTHRQAIGCVALFVDRDCSKVSYQYSVANPADEFYKSLARDLTVGRLVNKPCTLELDKKLTLHQITAAIMKDISCRSDVPKRAQKSAKLWLQTYPANAPVEQPVNGNNF